MRRPSGESRRNLGTLLRQSSAAPSRLGGTTTPGQPRSHARNRSEFVSIAHRQVNSIYRQEAFREAAEARSTLSRNGSISRTPTACETTSWSRGVTPKTVSRIPTACRSPNEQRTPPPSWVTDRHRATLRLPMHPGIVDRRRCTDFSDGRSQTWARGCNKSATPDLGYSSAESINTAEMWYHVTDWITQQLEPTLKNLSSRLMVAWLNDDPLGDQSASMYFGHEIIGSITLIQRQQSLCCFANTNGGASVSFANSSDYHCGCSGGSLWRVRLGKFPKGVFKHDLLCRLEAWMKSPPLPPLTDISIAEPQVEVVLIQYLGEHLSCGKLDAPGCPNSLIGMYLGMVPGGDQSSSVWQLVRQKLPKSHNRHSNSSFSKEVALQRVTPSFDRSLSLLAMYNEDRTAGKCHLFHVKSGARLGSMVRDAAETRWIKEPMLSMLWFSVLEMQTLMDTTNLCRAFNRLTCTGSMRHHHLAIAPSNGFPLLTRTPNLTTEGTESPPLYQLSTTNDPIDFYKEEAPEFPLADEALPPTPRIESNKQLDNSGDEVPADTEQNAALSDEMNLHDATVSTPIMRKLSLLPLRSTTGRMINSQDASISPESGPNEGITFRSPKSSKQHLAGYSGSHQHNTH